MLGILLLVPFVLLVHFALLVNTRFTLWPEMVVYPYLLNNNFLLYKEIINPYPPAFIYFLAQFSKIFGYVPKPYLVFTWTMILLTDVLIFAIAAKINKRLLSGVVASIFFTFLSIPFGVNGLWFDLIQTPFILVSFFYFYEYLKEKDFKKLFISFLLITIAFFIKQQAAWLAIWFLFYLLVISKNGYRLNFKRIFWLSLPFVLISLIHTLYFARLRTLEEFWFWAVNFPIFEAPNSPGYILTPTVRQLVVVISLFALFISVFKARDKRILFILATSLFLFVFAYPRFDFFHLIPALAVLSLAIGPFLNCFSKETIPIKVLSTSALIFLSAFAIRSYIINWKQDVRFFEPEIFSVANYLSANTDSSDLIYIQNGPDQLLPLSRRLPPKPWADEFPWYLETDKQQERVVNAIKNQKPKLVIFKPYEEGGKYDLGSYRPEEIVGYIDENYKKLVQISDNLWLRFPK